MITSINGLSDTPIQETTIQKENVIENITKEGKQDKNATEEKLITQRIFLNHGAKL